MYGVYLPKHIRKQREKEYVARKELHNVFDPLWKNGTMTRFEAYCLLRVLLKKNRYTELHISQLSEADCKEATRILRSGKYAICEGKQLAAQNMKAMISRRGIRGDPRKAARLWNRVR